MRRRWGKPVPALQWPPRPRFAARPRLALPPIRFVPARHPVLRLPRFSPFRARGPWRSAPLRIGGSRRFIPARRAVWRTPSPQWTAYRRRTGQTAGGRRGWATRPPGRLRITRGKLVLLFLLAFVLSALAMAWFLDARLKEPLFFLAKTRITQIATEAVNTAIAARYAEQAAEGGLIRWQTNEKGGISGFVIDYREQMRIVAETVRVVQEVLREKEELPERIPIGHALDSPLISAIGPQVAVRFHPISAVRANVETRQHEAGINHVLVEVFLRVRTDVAIVIPFDRQAESIETEIPLTYVLVAGDVPLYYYDNKGNPVGGGSAQAPPIVLPAPGEPD
jgi:sporulation protein YunB